MCELLAFSSKTQQPINEILKSFYKRSNNHPHGWGLALFDKDSNLFIKEPLNAQKSTKLKELQKDILKSSSFLAHIRYATTGDLKYNNTHPFEKKDLSGRNWVLIHNGTVVKDELLEKYKTQQQGDTDSERVLLYIVDKINKEILKKNRLLSSKERFNIVDETIENLASGDNKLNLMIFDEEQFYIHTNGTGQLFQAPFKDGILISTGKLDLDNLKWESFPKTQTIAIKNGQTKFVGKNHGNTYIPDPKIEQELFLRYAYL